MADGDDGSNDGGSKPGAVRKFASKTRTGSHAGPSRSAELRGPAIIVVKATEHRERDHVPGAGYFVDPRVKACVIFNGGRRPKRLGEEALMTRPMTRFDAPSRSAHIMQMTRGWDSQHG
jgi:hypothetical protein